MPNFAYTDAPVPIRDLIPAAHRRAWERLARPGNWWTGAERVAIASELRRAPGCSLCLERKAALSPNAGQGTHDGGGEMSELAIDTIHRIVTDPGRLSKGWYEGVIRDGLSEGQYVELVGVVVSVLSIDTLHRGLGIPLEPLPQPLPGEPSRERPAGLQDGVAWVPMLDGRVGNVLRALSLVPDAVEQLKELSAVHYVRTEDVGNISVPMPGLNRRQVELVAGRISALNECFY